MWPSHPDWSVCGYGRDLQDGEVDDEAFANQCVSHVSGEFLEQPQLVIV